jgi:hypothetical protein
MSDAIDFAVDFGPLIACFVVALGFAVVATWFVARNRAKAEQRAADEAEWANERVARFHSK